MQQQLLVCWQPSKCIILKVVAAACLSERYQTFAVHEHAAVALKERIVASQHNKTTRCGCGSMYVLAYIVFCCRPNKFTTCLE
ncbi:hypothetical protein NC652_015261 [Populus alba x Populus x berolinensis]|nr:hypothetical protein NC652_015261 [Populus alba x Populus x berolinensis]